MATQRVFSSMLYQAKCLAPTSALFKSLLHEVSQIETADTEGRRWSERHYPNGYTSYGSWDQLHQMSPHFQELKKKIDPHATAFIQSLAWDVRSRDIRLTRLWVNVMPRGTVHTSHLHPLSVLSGTFYLEVGKGASPLKFEDPRFGLFMGRPPVRAKALRDQQSFLKIDPKPGEVVLFESWMRHEVPLHTGPKPRISVSFNYDWVRA